MASRNLPLAFTELLAAALLIDHGAKAVGAALKGGGGGAASVAGGPSSATPGSGSILAALTPAGTKAPRIDRHDQGRDLQFAPGTQLLAPGDFTFLRNGSDPSGFGISYPILHFTSGPWAGLDVYFGHVKSLLTGGSGKAGTVIGETQDGTGPYVGNAAGLPGWAEIGLAPGGNPGPLGQQLPPGL